MYHEKAKTLNEWLKNDNWTMFETVEAIQNNLEVGNGVAFYIHQSIRDLINRGGEFTGEDIFNWAFNYIFDLFVDEADARAWLEIYKADYKYDSAFFDGYGHKIRVSTFEEFINLKWGAILKDGNEKTI